MPLRYFFRRPDGLWEDRFIGTEWFDPSVTAEDRLQRLESSLYQTYGAGNYYIVPPTEASRPEEV